MEPDGYPTNWRAYASHVSTTGSKQFGFISNLADVNRFSARFRAAACYRGVILEGYSDATAKGYSALCRTLFTWSAFESFLVITEQALSTMTPCFQRYEGTEVAASIRKADTENRFYAFIYERVNPAHKRELDSYFKDNPCNMGYLASAIRHIFAHGWLTPNANQVDPLVAVTICDSLCDFLLRVMDREFGSRVAIGLDNLIGR